MKIITIDTGTTNTRAHLWNDCKIINSVYKQIGVKDTAITGNKYKLSYGIKQTIEELTGKLKIDIKSVDLIIASGMITSNVGLYEIPHVIAPANITDLANHMTKVNLPNICELPIWFIPGVKNFHGEVGIHNCESMDMMRGEETEVIGLLKDYKITKPTIIILTGSHTKIVYLNKNAQILGCSTTISGEIIQAVSKHTIIADAVDRNFADYIDSDMLFAGAGLTNKVGFGRACFSIRVLEQFAVYERNARANFLLGAVLANDLLTIKNSDALKINPFSEFIVSGSSVLTEAIALLIQKDSFFSGEVVIKNNIENSNIGALLIAKEKGLLNRIVIKK